MPATPPTSSQQTMRTFAAGAGCGFLGGAFLVAAIVWQFGNVIGTRSASNERSVQAPRAVERWVDGLDDAGAGVIEAGRPETPVATSGAGVAPSAPSSDSVPGAPIPEELAARELVVPVEGVQPDALVRSFDEARGGRRHEAIDILAPRNTPVMAIEDGTVARLFNSKAGGITLYQFDPTGRYCYYYAHLERYADGLTEGQELRKGQVIGYVGTSGNAPKETPHLHFAIFRLTGAKRWWEGTPIDPYDVLR